MTAPSQLPVVHTVPCGIPYCSISAVNIERRRGFSHGRLGSIQVYTGSWMNASASACASRGMSSGVAGSTSGCSIPCGAIAGCDPVGRGSGKIFSIY